VAGLKPTVAALKPGRRIALANKETLVCAGAFFMAEARRIGATILPLDSEHNAVSQALAGRSLADVTRITLTASGGPFRSWSKPEIDSATREQALKHPNYAMGAKITIDSASLMNKGLEVIEAKWLFHLPVEKIDVIVHPQSIVHSLVQFEDGSMKAQMGLPDMKLPIQYAMAYPTRLKNTFPRFDFLNYPNLSFEKADMKTFHNLALAFEALKKGGNMPCILNAANEIAVEAFLQDKIGFLEMSDLIEKTMAKVSFMAQPTYEHYIATDIETRSIAKELI
jgi:1-deoxy-D-xylulose-5-phosphate reductoisomerase